MARTKQTGIRSAGLQEHERNYNHANLGSNPPQVSRKQVLLAEALASRPTERMREEEPEPIQPTLEEMRNRKQARRPGDESDNFSDIFGESDEEEEREETILRSAVEETRNPPLQDSRETEVTVLPPMQDTHAAIETIVGNDDFDFVNIAPENEETFEPLIEFENENVTQEEIDPSVKYTYFLSNKEMGGVYNTIEEAERALHQLEDVPPNKTKRRKKGSLPHNIYYTYTHDGVTPIGHYQTLQELHQKRIHKIFLNVT
jgi:hypothetical protein